jgi:lipoate-protein ligase A
MDIMGIMERGKRVCKMIIADQEKKVCDCRVLAKLMLWNDVVPHDGPTNMAIDDWLWRNATIPILRVYRWQGEWMSIGYFSALSAVPEGRDFVRRPTGGGVVDHREDWTYTLVVPRGFGLAELPGAESYQIIHQAIRDALREERIDCELVSQQSDAANELCFDKPVVYDLVDTNGRKVAGAGQRRGKQGLLHQGSLQFIGSLPERAERLASLLSREVITFSLETDVTWIEERCEQVYRNRESRRLGR